MWWWMDSSGTCSEPKMQNLVLLMIKMGGGRLQIQCNYCYGVTRLRVPHLPFPVRNACAFVTFFVWQYFHNKAILELKLQYQP